MAKVDYGAVALIPVGEYSASRQYHANELVGYQGSSYIALQNPPVGTLPTNTTYFMLHTEGTSIATASTPGTVKPDGTSTVVDASGAMSVKPSIVQTIQGTAEIAADTAEKVGAVPTGKTLQSQVDGLEPRVSSSEQALTVNLLNPTLESKTVNGVTITKNSDNTYTFNGTATADVSQTIGAIDASYFQHFDRIRLCGTPYTTGDNSGPRLFTNSNPPVREYGNGETLDATHLNVNLTIGAKIPSGFTCDNLVFKPMLTTNLSATYDDYVPYSGSSGKLDTDFKTLSQKIGNVGNTDLQSQLNAATQSIAQNTANVAQNATDIAANAAAISALNTGLTYSFISSQTGVTPIALPTAFNKVYIEVSYGGKDIVTFNIPKVALTNSNKTYISGWGFSGFDNYCYILISSSSVHLGLYKSNDTDHTNEASVSVYVR